MSGDSFEGYEATPQQLAAWKLVADDAAPEASLAVRVTGPVDQARLADALRAVVDRNEVLRTELRRAPGLALPLAVILSESVWRHDVEPADDGVTLRLTGPMYGMDAWSADGLCRQLAAAYAGTIDDDEEPLQYADFAAWQEEILDDPGAASGFGYWRSQAGASFGAVMPYRADDTGAAGRDRVAVPLDGVDVAALTELAGELGVGTRSLLLAAWLTVLSRTIGQAPLVGVASDGRGYPELAGAVGPYGRFLPVKVDAPFDQPFADLAPALEVRAKDHDSWQEYFLWNRVLGITLDEAADYFFPITFEFADLGATHRAGDVAFSFAGAATGLDRNELGLRATMHAGGVDAEIAFDRAHYPADGVAFLAEQVGALLADLPGRAAATLATQTVLSPSQKQHLTTGLNDTAVPVDDRCLHELFEQAVPDHADRPAIRIGDREITYRALDKEAERVAARLRGAGVGRSDLVGVCLGRGIEAVAAWLGVLKAGAAFVPLDPKLPTARLEQLIAGIAPAAVLTSAEAREHLPAGASVLLVEDDAAPAAAPASGPGPTPADLAYVIYTSGSTGTPKGVMIDHRGAVNTLVDINRRFSVGPEDKLLAVSAPTFDLAIYDIFGVLGTGALVVLVPDADAMDPRAWVDVVAREGITLWDSVPALFGAAVHHARERAREALRTLRAAMLSGDWIPVDLPDAAKALIPGLWVESMGGATEASIWSIRHRVDEVDPAWPSIPYGRAMDNQAFYVLDEHMEPCPPWVPGELAIGGIGVALGYFGQPGLSAQRFVADPCGDEPGARVYLTGDRGRLRPDGTIEFMGRIDDQLKVRGYRIEPTETTAQLLTHADVREAVTVPVGVADADLRLVSYAVTTNGLTKQDVRAYLADRLPDYLVPADVVFMEDLPLTENGKIDRAALPVPEMPIEEYVAPRNAVEEDLATMWSELLERERISAVASFFELGGHSLLLSQLATRITEQLGVDIPLQSLFEDEAAELVAEVRRTSPDPS